MNAWQRYGRKAQRYLGTSVTAEYLRAGDMITGWESAPWMVVESAPVPHPTHAGWYVYRAATAHGVGSYVLTEGETVRVGRIPLTNTDPDAYAAILGTWQAPCGCVVSKGEHCEECGPYNAHSPMSMNTWEYNARKRGQGIAA
ncbi:hypothetical protein [Streptomyces pseudogriseolus]|uniref:hypothetical protein n=1 Tax=Streptomyces pseudogriseolus TaxID=36817 RepID=UPI003FA27FBD